MKFSENGMLTLWVSLVVIGLASFIMQHVCREEVRFTRSYGFVITSLFILDLILANWLDMKLWICFIILKFVPFVLLNMVYNIIRRKMKLRINNQL